MQLEFPITEKEAKELNISNRSEINKGAIFPTRLRKLRQNKNVSQLDVSKNIGVTKSTISLYEQGDSVPDAKTLVKLSEYYGVSCNYLLLKTNNPQDVPLDWKDSPVCLTSDITSSNGEINGYIKEFTGALSAFSTLPYNEKQEFVNFINCFITALKCCKNIGSADDIMGQRDAISDFHHATTQILQICSGFLDKAYKKQLSFCPKQKRGMRISSKEAAYNAKTQDNP